MKFLFVFSLLIVAVWARGYTQGHNGRPGCKTAQEAANKLWRNNFDSTRYWECVTPNVAGEPRACLTEHQFQPRLNHCVHYLKWVWTPFEDPPSMA